MRSLGKRKRVADLSFVLREKLKRLTFHLTGQCLMSNARCKVKEKEIKEDVQQVRNSYNYHICKIDQNHQTVEKLQPICGQ